MLLTDTADRTCQVQVRRALYCLIHCYMCLCEVLNCVLHLFYRLWQFFISWWLPRIHLHIPQPRWGVSRVLRRAGPIRRLFWWVLREFKWVYILNIVHIPVYTIYWGPRGGLNKRPGGVKLFKFSKSKNKDKQNLKIKINNIKLTYFWVNV